MLVVRLVVVRLLAVGGATRAPRRRCKGKVGGTHRHVEFQLFKAVVAKAVVVAATTTASPTANVVALEGSAQLFLIRCRYPRSIIATGAITVAAFVAV